MRARWITLALSGAVALSAAACDIPQDPRNTLSEAQGDTLHVGVTEAYPWVIRSAEEPTGIEPALVRAFARSIEAEVHWIWGSVEEHMEALGLYEVDIAIGGFTRSTPWRKHVGLTAPYHTTPILIGMRGGVPPNTEEGIEGRPVAVPESGAIAGWVRKAGGEPRPMEDLGSAEGLVAAPEWKLRELGLDTTGFVLRRARHVMAVPPGENRFLMALENALHGADVEALITRAVAGRP